MSPADLTISQLGHGPATVSMVAGLLVGHGVPPLDCVRVAKERLAALVLEKRAEVVRVGGVDVYRLSASTPVETDEEPQAKMKRGRG